MIFMNPSNGYQEAVKFAGLKCLLAGPIYFVCKGVWTHAIASALLAFVTAGFSWVIYPFFARDAVATSYLRRGWVRIK